MKVVALQGKESCGKSTTLVLTLALMQMNTTVKIKATKGNAPSINDTWEVFEHKGKTIGITTRGDTADLIKKDYCDMVKSMKNGESLDVFVCAVHTTGSTVSCVETLTGEDTLLIIGKSVVSSNSAQLQADIEAKVNCSQAVDLTDIILSL